MSFICTADLIRQKVFLDQLQAETEDNSTKSFQAQRDVVDAKKPISSALFVILMGTVLTGMGLLGAAGALNHIYKCIHLPEFFEKYAVIGANLLMGIVGVSMLGCSSKRCHEIGENRDAEKIPIDQAEAAFKEEFKSLFRYDNFEAVEKRDLPAEINSQMYIAGSYQIHKTLSVDKRETHFIVIRDFDVSIKNARVLKSTITLTDITKDRVVRYLQMQSFTELPVKRKKAGRLKSS